METVGVPQRLAPCRTCSIAQRVVQDSPTHKRAVEVMVDAQLPASATASPALLPTCLTFLG